WIVVVRAASPVRASSMICSGLPNALRTKVVRCHAAASFGVSPTGSRVSRVTETRRPRVSYLKTYSRVAWRPLRLLRVLVVLGLAMSQLSDVSGSKVVVVVLLSMILPTASRHARVWLVVLPRPSIAKVSLQRLIRFPSTVSSSPGGLPGVVSRLKSSIVRASTYGNGRPSWETPVFQTFVVFVRRRKIPELWGGLIGTAS